MNKSEYKELIVKACHAAIAAGKKIIEIQNSEFSVELKKDFSPLTEADRNAHRIISYALSNSGIPVLSEEGSDISYDERKKWNLFWLVDPLDGTKEFISRNGEYTVNIALLENNIPVAGVIYHPHEKKLYAGIVDEGFFIFNVNAEDFNIELTDKNKFISSANQGKDLIRIVASRSHLNAETNNFIEEKKNISNIQIKNAGSSLKFCMIAADEADIYPRFGPTMEWDTAAGHAILKSAGKNIYSHPEGTELTYNKPSLLNGWFIAK